MSLRVLFFLISILCIIDGILTHKLGYEHELNPFIKSDFDLIVSRIIFFSVSIPCFIVIDRWFCKLDKTKKRITLFFLIMAMLIFYFAVVNNLLWIIYLT